MGRWRAGFISPCRPLYGKHAAMPAPEKNRHWHHAPVHLLLERGTFMVTAATYKKQHFFTPPARLQHLHDALLENAAAFGWELQAWAVFPNHYHFVGVSPENPACLRNFLGKLHACTARDINHADGTPGRKVWHQFRDTRLTYERSYFARLHYVHANAVHHGLVRNPARYEWCSAARFECEAPAAFRTMVYSIPLDRVSVVDDF
jgi:putative transposase